MNYNIDHNRSSRIGFPEVIYGSTKNIDTLFNIVKDVLNNSEKVLLTKLQKDKYVELSKKYQDIFYDEVSQTCIIGKFKKSKKQKPEVVILSGGTSDEFVVNEIYYTLTFLGISVNKHLDVGVAGVHRLLNRQEEIGKAKVVIVCAGFEGALPTVVGGLFPQPIIGVPVSVGYGVAERGLTALNSMLASCADGITVTNIDNGYGAAIAAYRILKGK